MAKLTDFIISKVRVKMLELFFRNPNNLFYVRQITREIDEEINAVRRELERMSETGMLKSEKRGNRLYYFLNRQYDFYSDLLRMLAKTTGLGLAIKKSRQVIGNPKFVMFSGKFAQHRNRAMDEVDILLVGDIKMQALEPLVKEEEKSRGHEINYTVMTLDEFEFRKARHDPFLQEVLAGGPNHDPRRRRCTSRTQERTVNYQRGQDSFPLITPLVKTKLQFFLTTVLLAVALLVALPNRFTIPWPKPIEITKLSLDFTRHRPADFDQSTVEKGLDIVGGTQVTLAADMKDIPVRNATTLWPAWRRSCADEWIFTAWLNRVSAARFGVISTGFWSSCPDWTSRSRPYS